MNTAKNAAQVGLELHPQKTKILTNDTKSKNIPHNRQIHIGNISVGILPHEKTIKYLRHMVSFDATHPTEVQNRTNLAWKKFHSNNSELCCREYSLQHRLRLFDSIISPSFLYACETWTITVELAHKIRKTYRHMIRIIFGKKHPEAEDSEPWTEWLSRITHEIEEHVDKNKIGQLAHISLQAQMELGR